jgi:hypothetical protein
VAGKEVVLIPFGSIADTENPYHVSVDPDTVIIFGDITVAHDGRSGLKVFQPGGFDGGLGVTRVSQRPRADGGFYPGCIGMGQQSSAPNARIETVVFEATETAS